MPVDTRHYLFDRNKQMWRKCRDCFEGEDAVKTSTSLYLPALSGQLGTDYLSYLNRANFYGATGRTVRGLAGAALRSAYQVTYPGVESENDDNGNNPLKDIGSSSESLRELVKQTLEEVISLGRCGLMVDAPEGGGDPYVTIYYAENIINWRTEEKEGRKVLTLVVLLEETPVPKADDFYIEEIRERYRVLRLNESGYFVAQVFEKIEGKNGKEDEYISITEEISPRFKGGKTLDFIPFIFTNVSSTTAGIEQSPVYDLVNVNLSHYRNSADLEHGLHFTALPTAYALGMEKLNDDDAPHDELRIGSAVVWTSTNPDAKVGFLEFTGAGLGSIRDTMESKERQMAVLGARLLEEQKKDAEAGVALKIRQQGERSILSSIIITVSEAFTIALRWVAKWSSLDDSKVLLKLSDNFDATGIDSQTLTSYLLALQQGAMSFDVFFYNLQKAGVYPEGATVIKEKELIAAGGPLTPAGELLLEDQRQQIDIAAEQADDPNPVQ